MEIKNWEKLNGRDFVMDGVEMVFGDCKHISKNHYHTRLIQKSNQSELFVIDMDSKKMEVVAKLGNFSSAIRKPIEKDDLVNLNEFLQYVRWLLPFINGVHTYLTIVKVADDLVHQPPGFGSASLSGNMGVIGPTKKYMSKSTAKMPVSMSIDDNELW